MPFDPKNIGPLINTMVNPLAGQVQLPVLGKLTGERYTPQWFRPSGAAKPSEADKLLFQAGALMSTYAAAVLALRYVSGRRFAEKEKKKMLRLAHSALNARRPIIAVDPRTSDTAAEERERRIGLEGLQRRIEASDRSKGKLVAMLAQISKEAQDDSKVTERALAPETWSLVVPVAAVLAGVYGADKIYQNIYTAQRKTKMSKDIDKTRNLLNRKLYEYLVEARGGVSKEGAGDKDEGIMRRAVNYLAGVETPSSRAGGPTRSAKAALWLAILGLFGVSAMAAKEYFDKRDENRQRQKQLLGLTRRLGTVSAPPVLIPPVGQKEYEELNVHLNRPAQPKRPKLLPPPQTTVLPERTISESAVDPTDELLISALNQ